MSDYVIHKDELFAEAIVQMQQAQDFVLIYTTDHENTYVLASTTTSITINVCTLASELLNSKDFEDKTHTVKGAVKISGDDK